MSISLPSSVQMLVEVPMDVLPALKQVAVELNWTLAQVIGQACLEYATFAHRDLIPLVEVARSRKKAEERARTRSLT